jgi:hypothetical protein
MIVNKKLFLAQEELIESAVNDDVPVFDRGRNDGQKRDFNDFKI